MKILALFDLAHAVDPAQEFSPESLKEQDKPTEACVLECLKRLGHDVETLAVFDNVPAIVEKLTTYAPDLVFNLSESFHHDRSHEPNIPALLDLMKVRYTGSGPDALLLCKDKVLTKKVLAYHRVHSPNFVVSNRAHPLRHLARFNYPAFVKPVGEESSDGISKASFARDEAEAIERTRYIHQKFDCDVLIEEYIDGRELYLSVLGNHRLTVFPAARDFLRAGARRHAQVRHLSCQVERKIPRRSGASQTDPPSLCPTACPQQLAQLAKKVYRLLKIQGFGRIDVRISPKGEVFVIEANPNPSLADDEDFAQAALNAGVTYDALIQEILNAALA